ncbi:MAG: ywqD [Frankiales bacterium]|jgi:succinoglycan biosynthesis transport protein ExoP|nr:ywqD [Frankiales bacterium]
MTAQRREPTWRVLFRSRWLIAGAVLLISASTAALSKAQAPVYRATSTLIVNQPESRTASFEVVQANQAFARTLAHIIGKPTVADRVAADLPFRTTGSEVSDRMSFTPVNETQLIEIHAEDRDPVRARDLANAYAKTFVEYVRSTLPEAAPSSGLSVADVAVAPRAPTRPKPTLYTLVAFLFSTALVSALVIIRDRLDTRVHDADALAELFGLPVLGVLPAIDSSPHAERRFEEAVRLLCTTLQHATTGPLRTLVVTSSREGEGKSTVSAELAEAFATLSLVESAVLAVDADLRRPALHLRAGLGEEVAERRGLTTYLREEAPAERCMLETPLTSLRIMPSGPLPTHPSTLLGFATTGGALQALRQYAQIVVFDTPPLAVGADASLVAAQSDGVVIVVDLAKTREPELRASVDQLSKVGAKTLGFVVNRSRTRERSGAYGYYERAAEKAAAGSEA